MPISTQGRGAVVSQLPVPERKPDYYIGPTGRPVLTMGLDRTSPGTCDSANGTSNSKLNKCLYNLTIRNAGYPQRESNIRQRLYTLKSPVVWQCVPAQTEEK